MDEQEYDYVDTTLKMIEPGDIVAVGEHYWDVEINEFHEDMGLHRFKATSRPTEEHDEVHVLQELSDPELVIRKCIPIERSQVEVVNGDGEEVIVGGYAPQDVCAERVAELESLLHTAYGEIEMFKGLLDRTSRDARMFRELIIDGLVGRARQ